MNNVVIFPCACQQVLSQKGVAGFFSIKINNLHSFVKSSEIPYVIIWLYINKIELNHIEIARHA